LFRLLEVMPSGAVGRTIERGGGRRLRGLPGLTRLDIDDFHRLGELVAPELILRW
jgi:hypothetical protein